MSPSMFTVRRVVGGIICSHCLLVASWAQEKDSLKESAAGWQVTRSELSSNVWQRAVNRATQHAALRAGAGQLTLMRVLLDGTQPKFPRYLGEPESTDAVAVERTVDTGRRAAETDIPVSRQVVNGIPLFFPDLGPFVAAKPKTPPSKDEVVQVSSTKVVSLEELQGGGVFQELKNGDFILVEHINSTRRQEGRDPVEIGSFTHNHAHLWVQVPPAGQLGILGDVILSRPQASSLGNIVAEIRFSDTFGRNSELPPVRHLQFGPVVVGGPYGMSREFNGDFVCNTGLLPPGEYKLLLPDFDLVKSRWTVTVKPGHCTRVRFEVQSAKLVVKTEETSLSQPTE